MSATTLNAAERIALNAVMRRARAGRINQQKWDDGEGDAFRDDLLAVHAVLPLDFDKLARAAVPSWFHDIIGIPKNLDRGTGQLRGGFKPLCVLTA